MKWRDLLLTVAVLLVLAPWIQAQTQPFGGGGGGGVGRFADGTAAAPSIAFVGATNMGIYRDSANTGIGISPSGTERVLLQNLNSIFDTNFSLINTSVLGWTSGSALATSIDVALSRKAAASLSVNNGTTAPASLQLTGSAVTLAVPAGALGFATSATSSVGQTGQGARLVVVCGPTSGTSSLLYYSGTSNTPVVLANAVGGGLIGC